MENKDYNCTNGAYHTNKCCDTCWNQHSGAKPNEMFMGTRWHFKITKEVWRDEAIKNGFSLAQAEFLFKNCR